MFRLAFVCKEETCVGNAECAGPGLVEDFSAPFRKNNGGEGTGSKCRFNQRGNVGLGAHIAVFGDAASVRLPGRPESEQRAFSYVDHIQVLPGGAIAFDVIWVKVFDRICVCF